LSPYALSATTARNEAARDLRLGTERRVLLAVRQAPGSGVRLDVQRVVHARVGPQTRDRDDAVVDLAHAAQVLPRDVGSGGAVLPVARVVEHEDALGVRRREGIGHEPRDARRRDRLGVPRRL
jgi:hypothetical protein